MRVTAARQAVDRGSFPVPRGQVFVIVERCKGCLFCIEFCPLDILRESEETNAKGYHFPLVVAGKEGECANCQVCTLVCPEFAIFTELLPEPAL